MRGGNLLVRCGTLNVTLMLLVFTLNMFMGSSRFSHIDIRSPSSIVIGRPLIEQTASRIISVNY